ncbi:MAG: hypothetical protein M3R25_06745 [Bacteroidota bacterium]|nr:hypothetical protein [Bacteroidota bacterium]
MRFVQICILLFCVALFFPKKSIAQTGGDQIIIGEDGIMRWRKDSSEIIGFGVNYTVPFAHSYRRGKELNVDLKAAIDADVYHFARLGLDLFRVHVWDTEISDTLGNLLENEHLELFDYLLFKLKERNIHAVITPIAYWGNGWPDQDTPSPGFSHKYGKDNCLTNPDAIKAQENYLRQFVSHINPYTKKAYKDEASILAFEVCNEPHHRATPEEVTTFVRKMKDAISRTGCTKPVFYNVTHSIHLADAYYKAGIDGGTFQWYPTGLGYQKELKGNMLPNVDRYPIPFDGVLKEYHSARFVYEFDAADMFANYMYPAMARSFRTAGMQLGTHFAYDPTFLAPFNTEYNTHFMNLVYAPQKALSLMIAGEVFRKIPLYSDYGVYPQNTSFGPFRVSYEENLAEMITDEKFIYTNNTSTPYPDTEKLKLIAGYGNSALVKYEGTGAYFLDKVGKGIWRLEVMPDAIIVDNLFGQNQIGKTRAIIKYASHPMQINLPEFADGFVMESVSWGDSIIYRESKNMPVSVKPGVYLVMTPKYRDSDKVTLESQQNIELKEYYAPKSNVDSVYVMHDAQVPWIAGQYLKINATVVAPTTPKKVVLWFTQIDRGFTVPINMTEVSPYQYEAFIPAKYIQETTDLNQYHFAVHHDGGVYYSPSNKKLLETTLRPDVSQAILQVEKSKDPLYLFNATHHFERLNRQWLPSSQEQYSGDPKDYVHFKLDKLTVRDPENLNAPSIADYSVRHYFGDLLAGREESLKERHVLVLKALSSDGRRLPVQITLVMKDGSAFGHTFVINDTEELYYTFLTEFKPVQPVLLPRPYPTFLPYFSAAPQSDTLDVNKVESMQFSIGPGIPESDWNRVTDVKLWAVWLE